MESLLQQLAEILGVGTDTLFQSYPVLQGQYIDTIILRDIRFTLGLLLFIGAIVSIFVLLYSAEVGQPLIMLVYLIIMLVLFFAYFLLKQQIIRLAPDLIFLEEMLFLIGG